MARKAGSRKSAKGKRARAAARKPARKQAKLARKRPARGARKTRKPPKPATSRRAAGRAVKRPNLDRPRKTVADLHGAPSSLTAPRAGSAAQTGREELKERLRKHTSTGPALTAGDLDANWESAESSGDEAPGGDNPTPDQDVVDEIGRALGVEYDDAEELQGGEEIADRDRHRWELDPGSKDDLDEE